MWFDAVGVRGGVLGVVVRGDQLVDEFGAPGVVLVAGNPQEEERTVPVGGTERRRIPETPVGGDIGDAVVGGDRIRQGESGRGELNRIHSR